MSGPSRRATSAERVGVHTQPSSGSRGASSCEWLRSPISTCSEPSWEHQRKISPMRRAKKWEFPNVKHDPLSGSRGWKKNLSQSWKRVKGRGVFRKYPIKGDDRKGGARGSTPADTHLLRESIVRENEEKNGSHEGSEEEPKLLQGPWVSRYL